MEKFNIGRITKEEQEYLLAMVERKTAIATGIGGAVGLGVAVYVGAKAVAVAACVVGGMAVGAGIWLGIDEARRFQNTKAVKPEVVEP